MFSHKLQIFSQWYTFSVGNTIPITLINMDLSCLLLDLTILGNILLAEK